MIKWIGDNSDWVFPLIVTIIFAIIEAIISIRQKKLAEWEISISLMEKRLEVFLAEKAVLQEIIDYNKPDNQLISDLTDFDMKVRFLFGDEMCLHWSKVMELVDQRCTFSKPKIQDGYGGFFDDIHDSEEEEMSMQAANLLGDALDLYKRYIDFSKIELIKLKEKNHMKRKAR